MANIRCVNIRKSYGGHSVIENLNLDIADHEFVRLPRSLRLWEVHHCCA